ncbi:MAG: DUF2236 domain-containing protein [Ardenticatenaceae bacterium]|nr:DUF2236 domain-containing protein [Ardenticatenaceae bacterium]
MSHRTFLKRILQLDPVRDHTEIVYLDAFHEFPFDTTRSLEFALFRTYAVPSIATLLDQTGEFAQRARKRYDDTDLLLSEILEHGYDSERGRAALRRMNRQHGRFHISNEDFLYVLSTFVFEPVRWIARFGYRPMVDQERLAWFYFWRQVGRRMNIHSIPEEYAAFERYNVDYEREHFRYTPANRRIAEATRDLFLGFLLPKPLWRLGEPAIYAMLDEPLLEAFRFPRPSTLLRRSCRGALTLRGRLIRLLPERQRPHLRTVIKRPTYPDGYHIEELGPPIERGSKQGDAPAREEMP